LCEAHDYLRQGDLTTSQLDTLQTKTLYGKEKKSLAYVIAIMNMILHGIEAPNVVHTNTLAENISDIQDKDRFDVILANPPFGGKERPEVQQNFPIKTGETAFLFLQHFIKSLKAGGRAAIVIKNTFLSNSDGASRSLRKELLENCNLHTPSRAGRTCVRWRNFLTINGSLGRGRWARINQGQGGSHDARRQIDGTLINNLPRSGRSYTRSEVHQISAV
jgi:hypothetical protein